MSNNILDPSSIIHNLSRTISDTTSVERDSSPQVLLKSEHDALAALIYTIMTTLGFRFMGLGEEELTTNRTTDPIQPLPSHWNASGPDNYVFRYTHTQSSLTFLLKSFRLSNKFLIHAMSIEDNKTYSLEITVPDYTSASFFPYTTSTTEPLINGFISSSRLNDLIVLFKINIVQKLIPSLNKTGYEESSTAVSSTGNSSQSQSQRPPYPDPNINDPLRIPGSGGRGGFVPPIFDNRHGGDEYIRGNPYNIGSRDLDPLSASPYAIGPPGSRLNPLGGGFDTGGGMIVGPNHPMFRPSPDGNRGNLYGGPRPLPRGSVPPGARFDPIGPFGPMPGARGPQWRGSGEPDNDDLPPPGYTDMFM